MSQKLRIGIVALFVATAAVLSAGGAVSVRAHEVVESETEHVNTTATKTSNDDPTEHQTTTPKERVQGRLNDAKKKTCNARVSAIKRIMTNAAAMGKKHKEVFDKILARVQEFYANKKLTVANYTELADMANAKKLAVDAAITAVENNVSFDCNSDNPVAIADAFNGKVKSMHQALKDYRTTIGNLLKAVKQAAQAAEGSGQ